MRQNFNFFADPEAAYMVLHEGVPLVMCGLDVTEQCNSVKKSDSEAVSVRKQNRKALRRYAGLFSGKHIRKIQRGNQRT